MMGHWVLWESPDGTSQSFFLEDNLDARQLAEQDGEVETWSVEAAGLNSAMQAMYDRQGWGTYPPALRDDGTPYPEDEDDSLDPSASGPRPAD